MYDIFVLTKDGLTSTNGKSLSKGGAKKFIDSMMASARGDSRPVVVAYRMNKFAYSRAR